MHEAMHVLMTAGLMELISQGPSAPCAETNMQEIDNLSVP